LRVKAWPTGATEPAGIIYLSLDQLEAKPSAILM
jgi:hypothetical protein